MNNRIIGKIFETKEYTRFKHLDSNREVTNARKKMLMNSIKENGYINNPINVNEKMEILDGQGRFEACKELNLPIQYIVSEGAGIEECMILNTNTKNWVVMDFIESYASQGNQSYIYLELLLKNYNAGVNATIYAVNNTFGYGGGNIKTIKNGKFKINENQYKKACATLSVIKELEPYINRIDGRKEVIKIGIMFAIGLDFVDNKKLIDSVKKRFNMIAPVATMEGFLEELSNIYNYKLRGAETRIYLKEEYDRRKRI